jgi:hypothetical protein
VIADPYQPVIPEIAGNDAWTNAQSLEQGRKADLVLNGFVLAPLEPLTAKASVGGTTVTGDDSTGPKTRGFGKPIGSIVSHLSVDHCTVILFHWLRRFCFRVDAISVRVGKERDSVI